MQELMNNNNEFTMNHVELCELINKLREEEGNKKELARDNFFKKIKKEVELMKQLNLEISLVNFYESTYINSRNKEYPTYIMNRNGILQIASSESVYVRAKIIEYINALENKVKELTQPKLPQTYLEALEQLVEVEREKQKLLEEKQENAPYVEFAKSIEATNESISVGDFAKILNKNGFNIGRTRLYNWLRNNEYLMKNNTPYQFYIDRKYFELVEYAYKTKHGQHIEFKTLITPKGQIYLAKKLINED